MNEYYKILLSEYIKPPSNMIDLSGLTLKSFTRHNNIVKAYIELNKENLITYIKSQITMN